MLATDLYVERKPMDRLKIQLTVQQARELFRDAQQAEWGAALEHWPATRLIELQEVDGGFAMETHNLTPNESASAPTLGLQNARLLAEILHFQRWAGGESVSAARIFGLMNGFETMLRKEMDEEGGEGQWRGISEETQRKVEDMLANVESETQSTNGMSIKDRLRNDGVDESDAAKVMQLCLLQSRFGPGIEAIVSGHGSPFSHLTVHQRPENSWSGALHHVELCDSDGGKMHSVFSPCVPRVGEIILPERGSAMRVVAVEHSIMKQQTSDNISQPLMPILIPHVFLEAIDDGDEVKQSTPS